MLLKGICTPKNSIERKLGRQKLAKLHLFCGLSFGNPSFFFYPTRPQTQTKPNTKQKKCTFFEFFLPLYPLQTLHFQKKIIKKCIFFEKRFGSVIFY